MLIRTYGLFWRVEEIDWYPKRGGGRNQIPRFALLGRVGASRGANLRVCDFHDQRGIYVLYGNYGPHYVGLSSERGLGSRLREHLTDTHSDAWDRFCWFGFRGVRNGRNTLGLYDLAPIAVNKRVNQREMIRELEAMLIAGMGLSNIRPGRFPVGHEWIQVRRDERDTLPLKPGRRPPEPRRYRWRWY